MTRKDKDAPSESDLRSERQTCIVTRIAVEVEVFIKWTRKITLIELIFNVSLRHLSYQRLVIERDLEIFRLHLTPSYAGLGSVFHSCRYLIVFFRTMNMNRTIESGKEVTYFPDEFRLRQIPSRLNGTDESYREKTRNLDLFRYLVAQDPIRIEVLYIFHLDVYQNQERTSGLEIARHRWKPRDFRGLIEERLYRSLDRKVFPRFECPLSDVTLRSLRVSFDTETEDPYVFDDVDPPTTA